MELANTCNEGDKSGAKCFVQLQVRCELTQDVEVQRGGGREGSGEGEGVGDGGEQRKVDSIKRREAT